MRIVCPYCGCWDRIKEIEPDEYMSGLGFKRYQCSNKRNGGLPCAMWYRKDV